MGNWQESQRRSVFVTLFRYIDFEALLATVSFLIAIYFKWRRNELIVVIRMKNISVAIFRVPE